MTELSSLCGFYTSKSWKFSKFISNSEEILNLNSLLVVNKIGEKVLRGR